MNVADFDYHLPPERIAQTPVEPRHTSRLMVVNRATGNIAHHTFRDIVNLLHPGDILVANDSRVIPARLFGRKETGGKVEVLLLKQHDDLRWQALVGGKRLRPGITVEIIAGEQGVKGAEIQERREAEAQTFNSPPATHHSPPVIGNSQFTILEDLGESRRLIEFNRPTAEWLFQAGHTPLPPYIHTRLDDAERYQTVFSRVDGSAAAPTAGLHFSPEVLLALRNKGVLLDTVTLHIGLDTFKPVSVAQVEAHQIHREVAQLNTDAARRINQTKLAGGRLVAVGTTAMRTLETAALRSAGVQGALREASTFNPNLCPWQPVAAIEEETDLFIYPGFTFRAVDVLLTNFHLPKSTLLMLVSAFTGRDLTRRAYNIAIEQEYRFYSFGDAMLIV